MLVGYLVMINADVKAVLNVQSCGIDFRDNCVVGIGTAVDDPKSVVINIEVDDVVVGRVEEMRGIYVLELLLAWKYLIFKKIF